MRSDLGVALVALGNPSDNRTWSATPSNLAEALVAEGLRVTGVNAQPSRLSRVCSFLLFQARRFASVRNLADFVAPLMTEQRSDYRWTRSSRIAAARKAYRSLGDGSNRVQAVLYASPMALDAPYAARTNVPSYAYIDNTFSLAARYSLGSSARWPPGIWSEIAAAEDAALASCQMVFTASKFVADDLIERGVLSRDRVEWVGVGLGRMRPALKPEKDFPYRCLFVARNSFERKGGDLAVAAIQYARLSIPDLSMDLVVDDAVARRFRGTPGLRFHPSNIPREELQELFERASVLLMPAINEPLGLVYFEALACEAVVLGLDRNIIPELQSAGCAIAVTSPSARIIADALVELLSDPEVLMKMQSSASKYCAAEVGWGRVASRIAGEIRRASHP